MVEERRIGDIIANSIIWLVTILLVCVCVLPFVAMIAKSLSSAEAVRTNQVNLWPVGINLDNYSFLMREKAFLGAFGVSVARVTVGVTLNLLVISLTAYPLSQDHIHIPGRTIFKVVLVFGMLFQGGLIPTYLAYKSLGLLNHFVVLVLPGALNIFFAILIINFFRGIPREMSESALMDGANHFEILYHIFLPLSLPSMATVGLFAAVTHWNSWFDGIIFLRFAEQWPLQSYLYNQVTQRRLEGTLMSAQFHGKTDPSFLKDATPEALAAAMVMIGSIPIMLVYPFVQRYFIRGLTLGAVKG